MRHQPPLSIDYHALSRSRGLRLAFRIRGGSGKAYAPVYHPELRISRAAGPIKIDGDLSDAGWRGAAKAANFAEHNPGDQTKPAVDTEVLITYDDDNLYVAWLCYDNPGEVRASFCERDKIFSGRLRDPLPRHLRRGDARLRDRRQSLRHSGRPSLLLGLRRGRRPTT